MNSQDLLPTLQFLLVSATYPGLQDKGAWMDKEDLSVERLEQQDRASLLPTTLLDLPGSGRCSQHGGTYGSYKG